MANEPLFAEERHNRILQMLRKQKKLLVTDLCEVFGVSPATIRNDLNDLEKRGCSSAPTAARSPAPRSILSRPPSKRTSPTGERKIAIGQAAADMVEDGDTIAVVPVPPPIILPRRSRIKIR